MGDNLPAIDLGSGRTALAISAGSAHACALLDNSAVKCWGFNTNGQLGQGSVDHLGDAGSEMGDNLPAIDLGSGRTALAISAGSAHTCAVLDNSAVKCWGYNNNGQLGQGSTSNLGDGSGEMGDNLTAIDLGSGRTALAISAGSAHTCALLDNSAFKCWGQNDNGQLGQGSTSNLGDGSGEMGDNLTAIDL
jgi:alpha-tubulin suppressor-like RCC1 family protein